MISRRFAVWHGKRIGRGGKFSETLTRDGLALELLEDRQMLTGVELDPTFGEDGLVTTDFFDSVSASDEVARDVAIQADGKLVVPGYTNQAGTWDFAVFRYLPNGALDPTFGNGGKVVTDFEYSNDFASSVAIQPDGKLVVGGQSNQYGTRDFALVRYLPDGSLDTTFGTEGKVVTALGPSIDVAWDIAIHANGSIIAAGTTRQGHYDFGIVRYHANGTLDASFGQGGIVITDFGDSDLVGSVAIQPDDKVVVVGSSYRWGTGYDVAVARYHWDGSLDTSFDGDGKQTTALFGHDYGMAVAIQPDAKIVAGGYSTFAGGSDFAIVRYNADGALDTSFGGDGKVTTDMGGRESAVTLAIQPDGKAVLAGSRWDPQGTSQVAVARYQIDGELDSSFDGDGIVNTELGPDVDGASGVAIQVDGKILVAGSSVQPLTGRDAALVRYLDDGSLDASFGNAGIRTTDYGSPDSGYGLAVQADGKLVVAGFQYHDDLNVDFALARYHPDGSLDATFGVDGRVVTDFGPNTKAFAWDIVILPDGKMLVSGFSATTDGQFGGSFDFDFALARYHPDGSLDTTFGTAGKVTTDFGSIHDYAHDIAIQPDGKIVLVGQTRSDGTSTGWNFALARYNSNGSADTAFGADGKVVSHFFSGAEGARAVAIQTDEQSVKLVVAGYLFQGWNSTAGDFALVRYNEDGSQDMSFGDNGMTLTDFGLSHDQARSMTVQPDGQLVVAGYSWQAATNADFVLARYDRNGTLDSAFGTDGKVVTDFDNSLDQASRILTQADGRLLVIGHSEQGSTGVDFALARYDTDGHLDPSFSHDGKVTTDFGNTDDFAWDATFQLDGKLVVAGTSIQPDTSNDFALARYDLGRPEIEHVEVGGDLRSLIISLNDHDLDVVAAENASNYRITTAGADDVLGTIDDLTIDISNVEYDAGADRITVRTVDAFFDALIRLDVDGDDAATDGTPGVTGLVGNHLDGGDFTIDFDLRTFSLVEALLAKTEALGLSTGPHQSLTVKLNAAIHLVGRKTADEQGIIAKLESFIHGILVWSDKGDIGPEDRDELIADTQFIIFGLSLL